ncbi:hypothetical protein MNBD_UNCLBAC01-582 [hydrothermal vent metagenome]|uniref:Uncharacterized protein n=1 Tax=hydrothermal vent metagenome TaxID=652676 RepID=A0A3B1E5I1_9ZZZZ
MKRTNVELDEKLVEEGMRLTGISTYKALINFSLQRLVQTEHQADLLKYFGKVKWSGNLDEMRSMR